MALDGYVYIVDVNGAAIYNGFTIDSTDTVRFHIEKVVDGVKSDYDVSSAALTVKFRAQIKGTTTLLINKTLTKISSGTTGIVQDTVKFDSADWTDGAEAECALVLIDTGTADGDTPSGYAETELYGRWLANVRQGLI